MSWYDSTESRSKSKSKHIGFSALAERVTREYERKGVSKKHAEEIGKETAGKVARLIKGKSRRRR